jgi:hypothetical protein
VDQIGGQYSILLDKELVPNRIVSAFNLVYEPEASRSRITGAWSHESTIRLATAIMAQAQPNILVGMEARYLRKYEGLGLDRFAGHALYLGPTCVRKAPGRLLALGFLEYPSCGAISRRAGIARSHEFRAPSGQAKVQPADVGAYTKGDPAELIATARQSPVARWPRP